MLILYSLFDKMKNRAFYIQELKRTLSEVKENFGVATVYLFGSVARDNFDKKSDLDLLVDFYSVPSLFKIAELQAYLESELQISVDIVEYSSKEDHFISSIKNDLIEINLFFIKN